MFIKKSRINKNEVKLMKQRAGYREENLMKTANLVYTSNNGRCIEFMNSKTGRRCQWDKKTKNWTN